MNKIALSTSTSTGSTTTKADGLNDLPDELILKVMSYLNQTTENSKDTSELYKSFINLSLVNKKFYKISFDFQLKRVLTITSKDRVIEDLGDDFKNNEWICRVAIRDNSMELDKVIAMFPNIKYLDLYQQKSIATPKALCSLFSTIKSQLLGVNLGYCSEVNEEVMKSLGKNCPYIQELGLRACGQSTIDGLKYLI